MCPSGVAPSGFLIAGRDVLILTLQPRGRDWTCWWPERLLATRRERQYRRRRLIRGSVHQRLFDDIYPQYREADKLWPTGSANQSQVGVVTRLPGREEQAVGNMRARMLRHDGERAILDRAVFDPNCIPPHDQNNVRPSIRLPQDGRRALRVGASRMNWSITSN